MSHCNSQTVKCSHKGNGLKKTTETAFKGNVFGIFQSGVFTINGIPMQLDMMAIIAIENS